MRTINLNQGDEAWHAHRATHYRTASRAPALMGASKYQSRIQLLAEIATGISPDHDDATLARFARGHEVEPALREYAEQIAQTELYPIVGVSDDGYLSASFDGVSMDEAVICECKQYNAGKIEDVRAGRVPDVDYWQVVQQLAVCDAAQKCIYVVGDGTPERTHELVVSRQDIDGDIAKLRAAWEQFDADLATYQHQPAAAAAVAAPVDGFGALTLRVEGRVLASNLDAFRAGAEEFIARLPRPAELQTDQDFSDAAAAVKACADAESRIKSAKDHAIAQMSDVDAVLRAADSVAEAIRSARLALDKAVKSEKESRKAELIRNAADAVRAHYAGINATLPGYEISAPVSLTADLGASIKGLSSLASIRDKLDAAVAKAKISANQEADRRRLCIAVIDEHAEHRALVPDAGTLVATKQTDDIRNLIAARIAEHEAKLRQQAEEAAERDRERIRREEEYKLRMQAEKEAQLERERIRLEQEGKEREIAENIRRENKYAPAAIRELEHGGLKEAAASQAPLTAAKPKRPTDDEIIAVLALHYRVHETTVVEWLRELDLGSVVVTP